MRKKLTLFFVVSSVLLLVACDGYDLLYTTTEVDSSVPFELMERGFWEGDTFVSEHFGLRFDLPDGWQTECDYSLWVDEYQIAFYERLIDAESSEWAVVTRAEISNVSIQIISLDYDGFYYDENYYDINFECIRIGRYYWYAHHYQSESLQNWSDFFIETEDALKIIFIRHTGTDELEYILSHFREY